MELHLDTSPDGRSQQCQSSSLRQTLAQVLAATGKSLIMLSIGMLIGFPTVLIPVLTSKDYKGDLHFNRDQASWYGALTYIFQPVGSIASGALLQSFGCKKLMILINVPQIGCWLMIYFATSNFVLYVSSALVGLVIGLMEAPTIRYISEISHPSLRGILTTYSVLFTSLGFLAVYSLGSLTDWQHVALISAAVPVICIIILFQIPETPMWLMSKGRAAEALEALQWLRGWTTADMVEDEFAKLEYYAKKKSCKTLHGYGKSVDTKDEVKETPAENGIDGVSGGGKVSVKPSVSFQVEVGFEKRGFADKLGDLTCKEMTVPLGKCIVLITLSCFSGLPLIRPYLVAIFAQLNLPIQPNWTSVLVTFLGIAGNIGCMALVNRVGKKPLVICSSAASAVCLILLSIFLMQSTPEAMQDRGNPNWWPLILFFVLFFSFNMGLQPLPWVYLSEILPYKGRGIATGIAASIFYIVIFFGVKMFSTMERELGLQGTFLLYAAVCIAGIFFTYFILPETEGRFLSDIETDAEREITVPSNKENTVNA
nr:PREDICTED: facilitated trehalose transporter Tret1-2 homolog isoform X1 [Bemisia tabaci]